MSDAEQIIAACTRNGCTSWQHVARQLGRSVDSVRAQYDAGYERAYVWAPSREPIPEARPEDLIEPEPDENDTSSPYAKGPGLKADILALLATQSLGVGTISTLLNRPVNSIRARLDRLLDSGKVWHDGRYPRTWGITEADGTRRIYGASSNSVYVAANMENDRRASKVHLAVEFSGGRRFNQWRG